MIVELICVENEKKLVVVIGWILYWMFVKWKLKFFDDLKKVYGDIEYVDIVVNLVLEVKVKLVWEFLKKFGWRDGNEVGQVMLVIQEGVKFEDVVKQWVVVNLGWVKDWVQQYGWFDWGMLCLGNWVWCFFLLKVGFGICWKVWEYWFRVVGEML